MSTQITQNELARRLRLARLNSGLSQEAVAAELGLPRPTVSQIEAGKRGVSGLELMKLSKLFGRPLGSFFEEDFEQSSAEDPFTVLFRSAGLRDEDRKVVSEFETFCRNYSQLESLLELEREIRLPDYSNLGDPRAAFQRETAPPKWSLSRAPREIGNDGDKLTWADRLWHMYLEA